ncbi:MAG: Stp1/IreP family PP2C-type Ser/Thr phosphatase [Bacteroidaceae bacterium]|nr:Stp1/IreP family PP2C-type Ser/Thr phosphatase [Bacteroidaceae bacterium]
MEQFNYCLVVGQTDVGRKRAANEDNMGNAITQNGLVSVVCDGMGGHVGGATASRIAVDAILENLKGSYYEDPRIAIGESIDIANRAILNEASARPELSGMGSTCVLLIVRNGKVYIGHVGDSRIYLIRSKRIIQLTKDHSYVQMLVDRREITKEQAEHHPRKNEITNALGIPNMSPATVADDAIIPEAGDCFILCSDGLSGMVSDEVINKVVSRQSELSAQARVDRLISIANENGGVDNITAQMVEFTITPGFNKPEKKIPLWLKILIPTVALMMAGLGLYFLINHNKDVKEEAEDKASQVQTIDNPTDVHIPDAIVFKAKEEFVTIEFGESSIVFKHNGKQIITENNTSFNPDSLKVNSPDIDIVLKGKNRVLKFTDNYPGEMVIAEVSSNEPRKIYRFYIPVSKSLESNPIQIPKKEEPTAGGTPAIKNVPVGKHEIIKIELGEYALTDGEKILFGYSAKPYMNINRGKDIPEVNDKLDHIILDEVKDAEIVFDDKLWTKNFNSETKQLSFVYNKREHNKRVKCKFVIPCVKKGSKDEVVLEITLTVIGEKEEKEVKEETPYNGQQEPKDSIPQDSTMITI